MKDAISECWHVAAAVGRHEGRLVLRSARLAAPVLLLPVCCYAAFAGGLSRLGDAPGFDYPDGYVTFAFGFAVLQSAVFAGTFAALSVARAYDLGFAARLALAGRRRVPIVVGYVIAAWVRAAAGLALLTLVALATGLTLELRTTDLLLLALLLWLVATVAALWGVGVACRMRSLDASPAIQVPAIVLLFATPAVLPLDLSAGWLRGVARANPLTAVLDGVRGLLAGVPEDVPAAAAVLAALLLTCAAWALSGARRFGERAN